MINFKNGNSISEYNIKVENSNKAISIIDEILSSEEKQKSSTPSIIDTNYGNYKKFSVNIIENGIETIKRIPDYEMRSYSRGVIDVIKYIYNAPYTLSLASYSFNFGKYNYSHLLELSNKGSSLENVLHGANINELSKLLECFNNNLSMLNLFLKNYHPDLYYLRAYLECISFYKIREYYSEDNRLDNVSKNTEVVRKLNLNLKIN